MPRTGPSDKEAFWRKLIARQSSSRISISELCDRAGVSTASFYAWRRRLKASPGVATSSLVPLRIVADGSGNHGVGGEITVELAALPGRWPTIRVRIPPGCDETSIRQVLGAVMNVGAAGLAASGGDTLSAGDASC